MSEIAACTLIQEEPDRKTERYMMMFKDYPDVVTVEHLQDVYKRQNLSCFQLPMQILFGMPEDRRKCIPSMVTIMEISVYLEITRR